MNALPSRRLLLLLAAASCLFLLSATAAAAVDALSSPAPALRLERRAPQRISLGATAKDAVVIENRGTLAARVRVTDDLPEILAREGGDVLETVVAPGREERVEFTVRADRRGDAEYGDVHLRVLGPLGLAWRQRRIATSTPLRGLPGIRVVRRESATYCMVTRVPSAYWIETSRPRASNLLVLTLLFASI